MKRTNPIRMRILVPALAAVALCAPAFGAEARRVPVRPACVPEGAEAWLVLPAPEVSLERFRKLAEAVAPGMGALAEATLKGRLARQGGDALDSAKPLVTVFAFGEKPAYAVALALKPESDAVKALEERFGKAAKADAGISTYLEVQEGALPDKEVYAAVKAGRLVLGDSLDLVKLLAAAPAPAAGDFDKTLDALIGVDVRAAAAKHREKIDAFLKKLETKPEEVLPGRRGPLGLALRRSGPGGAALIRSVLKEADQAGAELRLGEEEVSFSGLLLPAAEGQLAAAAGKLAEVKVPAAGPLPAGTLLTAAGNMPAEAVAAAGELMQGLLAAADVDGQAKKDIEALLSGWKDLAGQCDGSFSQVLVRRGGGLCGLVHLGGIKDAAAARGAAGRMIRAGLSEALMKQWGGGTKIKAEFKENHRQSGRTAVDRLSVDFTPAVEDEEGAAGMAELQRQMMDKLYGLPLVYELAATDKDLFTAFGKEAPAALDELLERAARGGPGTERLAAARAKAPPGSFVLGEVSILEYVRTLTAVMAGMAPVPNLDLGQEPGKPATFWARSADGQVTARFNLPVEPIKKLAEAFRKAQQEMIKQRQPPGPVPGDPGAEQF